MIMWLNRGVLVVQPPNTSIKKPSIRDCLVRAREQRVLHKFVSLREPCGNRRQVEVAGRRRKGHMASRTSATRAKRAHRALCAVAVGIQVPLPTGLLVDASTEGAHDIGDSKFVRQTKYKMHRYGALAFLPTISRRSLPILKMVDNSRRHNQTACYLNGRMHPADPRRRLYESRRAPNLGRDPHGSTGRDGP